MLSMPVVKGVIGRRMLINYRVDPEVAARLVPAPFQLKTVRGKALVGLCLIQLHSIRPGIVPGRFGIRSENAAHRFAVEWNEGGRRRSGVYIARRDTSSPLNALAGGRIFPGAHHLADFRVNDKMDYIHLEISSHDQQTQVEVEAYPTDQWPTSSVFHSLGEASDFFQQGSLGYSPSHRPDHLDGLELCSYRWKMEALNISHLVSSYFDDPTRFPSGSLTFDSALLMRDIEHEWHRVAALSPRL